MAEELILGFIAGVLSRAVSTPLSMITLQLQAQDTADEDSDDEGHTVEPLKKGNVATAARGIYKVHGFFGFWRAL
ncbi:hypothetical protein DXG01_004889 [Tephrocybe rancida]|nr:hypothetical protein DXG01_004889 [Tephrocybe rancida]